MWVLLLWYLLLLLLLTHHPDLQHHLLLARQPTLTSHLQPLHGWTPQPHDLLRCGALQKQQLLV
jgi:hypothetical protein